MYCIWISRLNFVKYLFFGSYRLYRQRLFFPHSSNLKQSSEGRSTYGTAGCLIAQRFRTVTTETKMSTGKNQCVTHVWHTYDALGSTVFHFIIWIFQLEDFKIIFLKQNLIIYQKSFSKNYLYFLQVHVNLHLVKFICYSSKLINIIVVLFKR